MPSQTGVVVHRFFVNCGCSDGMLRQWRSCIHSFSRMFLQYVWVYEPGDFDLLVGERAPTHLMMRNANLVMPRHEFDKLRSWGTPMPHVKDVFMTRVLQAFGGWFLDLDMVWMGKVPPNMNSENLIRLEFQHSAQVMSAKEGLSGRDASLQHKVTSKNPAGKHGFEALLRQPFPDSASGPASSSRSRTSVQAVASTSMEMSAVGSVPASVGTPVQASAGTLAIVPVHTAADVLDDSVPSVDVAFMTTLEKTSSRRCKSDDKKLLVGGNHVCLNLGAMWARTAASVLSIMSVRFRSALKHMAGKWGEAPRDHHKWNMLQIDAQRVGCRWNGCWFAPSWWTHGLPHWERSFGAESAIKYGSRVPGRQELEQKAFCINLWSSLWPDALAADVLAWATGIRNARFPVESVHDARPLCMQYIWNARFAFASCGYMAADAMHMIGIASHLVPPAAALCRLLESDRVARCTIEPGGGECHRIKIVAFACLLQAVGVVHCDKEAGVANRCFVERCLALSFGVHPLADKPSLLAVVTNASFEQ